MDIEDDELTRTSMRILIAAGDGRNATFRAITAFTDGDPDAVEEHLETAKQELQKAHKEHTECIQEEATSQSASYSMLFSHAQDTLMTAYSEYRISKKLMPVLRTFDDRLKALEEAAQHVEDKS